MKLQPISNIKHPFGVNPLQKASVVKGTIGQMASNIQQATVHEKIELAKALGINPSTIKSWRTKLEFPCGDIVCGKIFPNIDVITKGISPVETAASVANVELARIRGQLKRVSLDNMKL
ncbi:MAG: hypothetical protein K6A44_04750 [bacterium]|nr:hypothetical protein [bacterium]